MPALPRPDLPPGAHRDLIDALHDLHHRAGWPSLRTLAKAAGCSHTTVSTVFSSPRVPTWGNVEVLVEAMHGDAQQMRGLWLAASTPHGSADAQIPAVIAGRRNELAAVRRHIDAGRGLLVVAGEAGIGKTKLVDTAAALAGPTTLVAVGHCLPLSSEVPLLPVAEVMRTINRVGDGLWMKDALEDCPAYVRASLRRLLPDLDGPSDVLDADDGWSRQRLFAAVGACLAALAELRPLAVVLEDLHWADALTLDLVELLAQGDPRVPLVGTYRVDDATTRPATADWFTRLRRMTSVETLELSPLSREETAEQLELLLEARPSAELVDRIHRRSVGHPLFTEQLAADDGGNRQLPRLLADMLDRRLDGLGESGWRVGRALAIADRPLPEAVLHEAVGTEPDELSAGLHELAARHLLDRLSDPEQIRLSHPLIAEAVRRHLVPGEATAQHRRLATALGSSSRGSPGEIARHWQAAGEDEEELGWRIRAARAAEAVFASGEAADHWLRVIELWPQGHGGEFDSVRLGDAYYGAIGSLKASARLEQAAAVAEDALAQLGNMTATDIADIYLLASDVGGLARDATTGLALVDKAIAGYERLPPTPRFIRALRIRTGHLHDLGRYAEAQATVVRALEANAAVGDLAQQRRLLILQAWCQLAGGDREAALVSAESAARFVVPDNDPFGDIYVGVFHTDLLLLAGASGSAVEAAGRRGLDAAADWGIESENSAVLLANVAQALILCGQVDRAGRLVGPATDGPVLLEQWALHLDRAWVDLCRGREDDAVTRLAAVSHLPVSSINVRVEIAQGGARADIWRGQPRAALDRLIPVLTEAAAADESARIGAALVLAARAAADLVEVSDKNRSSTLRKGLSDELSALRAQLHIDPLAPSAASADRVAHASQWAAELSRLDGDQTVEGWVAAAAACDALTRPHDSAYCRWRAAQVAAAQGRATVAGTLLRRAARDAREHVPLSRALAETAAQAHLRERV